MIPFWWTIEYGRQLEIGFGMREGLLWEILFFKNCYFFKFKIDFNLELLVFSFRLGIPLVVVIGKKASDPENPQFELHFIQEEKQCDLPLNELIAAVIKYSQDKLKEDC